MKGGRLLRRVLTLMLLSASSAHAGAFGIGGELEIPLVGNAEMQWIVTTPNDQVNYALFGKSTPGVAPGGTIFYIIDKNLFIGGTLLFRYMQGEFQVPDRGPNKPIQFIEEVAMFRLGYIDYFGNNQYALAHWNEVIPAYPFGHFRLGLFRSDISSSPDFEDFSPAWSGFAGLEFGALYCAAERFHFVFSGTVDYSFGIVPYESNAAGRRDEILANFLLVGMALQFGTVTEPPN
ncbi:MAG: hypothetical protein M5R36_20910 [Deltaproteobacteria bacterium]|nr:hypothetical protein [Deltaproteobacteria bacterium]